MRPKDATVGHALSCIVLVTECHLKLTVFHCKAQKQSLVNLFETVRSIVGDSVVPSIFPEDHGLLDVIEPRSDPCSDSVQGSKAGA